MFSQIRVALADAPLDFRHQFSLVAARNFFRWDGLAEKDMDRAPPGQFLRPRPGRKSPFDGHRQNPGIRPGGQYCEPGAEGGHFAVAGSRAFRENEHHFAPLQAAERLLKAIQSQPVAVDGNRVQRVNQPAKRCKLKQGLPGQIIHSPPTARPDEWRVEVALMIRNDQDSPRLGYILQAAIPEPVGECACQADQTAEELVPNATWQGTPGHWARFSWLRGGRKSEILVQLPGQGNRPDFAGTRHADMVYNL